MNQLLTIGQVTMESLPVLKNRLAFAKHVRRDYDKSFGIDGAKIGDTLSIRKPTKYAGRTGAGFNAEDAIETSVQLVLTTQFGQDTFFTSKDFALNIDNFNTRFLNPAMARIANKIDSDGLLQYLNVANFVGVPGTVPNALLTYMQAMQKLNDNGADLQDRAFVISQAMEPQIVDSLKGLLEPGEEIAYQYDEGYMRKAIGGVWEMDQNVANNTVGPLGGSPTVNAGGQSGSSLVTNNWTAAAAARLKKGNCFTIGSGSTGCYAVNVQEKTQINSLQCFTVTADVSSDGSGNATIPISPAIVLSGPTQNVAAAPSAGATINVAGAANTVSPQGLCFQKGSFALGMADLEIVPFTICERKASDDLQISVRYLKTYDYNSDRVPGRFDVIYGWVTLYGETACRIMS